MDNLIPNSGAFFTENNYENEISNYVSQQFFRCVRPFLRWMKKGETYWFEYHNDGEYEVRSDNNLGQKFEMTTHQLLGNFYPVECETDICAAMDYAYWLGELGFHHGYIEEISMEIMNNVSNIEWLDWNEDNQNKVFKEIIDEILYDKNLHYKVNILVIAKEKKSKNNIDKFKGNYKIMPTEVEIYWNTNNTEGISFWTKNIANKTITKFVPMEMALPKELKK